jgi:hypothetical protein
MTSTDDAEPNDANDKPDAPPDDENATETIDAKDWQAEARKYQNLARSNAVKAKEAAALQAKLSAYEDQNKTELQKLTDRAAAAEARAARAETSAMRLDVAARKGLPAKLAARLQGESVEDMETDADELLAEINAKAPPGAPRRDPDQGKGTGGSTGGSGDLNDWMRRAANVPAS